MKLLVVEDDDRLSAALRSGLTRHGFEVVCARTGASALDLLSTEPDLVLLDLRLPDYDGFTICGRIRRISAVPILMVTGRSDLNARILGLNLGADDYLVKPYNLGELIARIRAVARRSQPVAAGAGPPGPAPAPAQPAEQLIVVGPIRIDIRRHTVAINGRTVTLTRKEFDLLGVLAGQPGAVFRHDEIINEVWHTNWPKLRRTLHVHMASLRQKLHDPGLIESVHGVGYRLNVPGFAAE